MFYIFLSSIIFSSSLSNDFQHKNRLSPEMQTYLSCDYSVLGECLDTRYPFYKSCSILYIFQKSKSKDIRLMKLNARHALDYCLISSIALFKVQRMSGRFLQTEDGSLENDDLLVPRKLCIMLENRTKGLIIDFLMNNLSFTQFLFKLIYLRKRNIKKLFTNETKLTQHLIIQSSQKGLQLLLQIIIQKKQQKQYKIKIKISEIAQQID